MSHEAPLPLPADADPAAHAVADPLADAAALDILIGLMLDLMADGFDHPDLWRDMPVHCAAYPGFREAVAARFAARRGRQAHLLLLHALSLAAEDDLATALAEIAPLAAMESQSALVQGVVFHLQGLADPDNPRYTLAGKLCPAPFEQLDVLERSTHQCCASWLHKSAGDLSTQPWQEVWNSPAAQAVRASVLDGSYRFCNKGACPRIQADTLVPAADLAATSPAWAETIATGRTALSTGPRIVNLAYDRTCNLACPSCRTERFAADAATRARFAAMQEEAILPLLHDAEVVFVTGSGDPFASKNFRALMQALTAEAFPKLRFQIMTNAMLLTPAQWASFPALHGRVKTLKISIDAATGPTHEALRRGAHWPTMLDNMAFAGRLAADGLVDHVELVFTVQRDNFREMGDAVDLAKRVGASGLYFARMTNWGTFTADQYRAKAVFLPDHPDHGDFIAAMQDPRLRDAMVLLGDLEAFAAPHDGPRRLFEH